MTVIAIRDGVLAVDSLISGGGVNHGRAAKWAAIPDLFGGGFAAASGDLARGLEGLRDLAARGEVFWPRDDTGVAILHLKADGSVWLFELGQWITYDAPFYAAGSGEQIALGAMAAGATAEEAVNIACEYSQTCGGAVHVLRLDE